MSWRRRDGAAVANGPAFNTWRDCHCQHRGLAARAELDPDCNCDPLAQTGGGHAYSCPAFEPECACYELTGGHQPGCYFNRKASARKCLGCGVVHYFRGARDEVVNSCECCAALPKPITFTDAEGREWSLRAEQSEHEPGGCLIRDATADDLARAGYEQPLTIRGHIDLLRSLGYHVEDPRSCVSEIAAHRALERRIREEGVVWCERHQLTGLLSAIDEAREKKT